MPFHFAVIHAIGADSQYSSRGITKMRFVKLHFIFVLARGELFITSRSFYSWLVFHVSPGLRSNCLCQELQFTVTHTTNNFVQLTNAVIVKKEGTALLFPLGDRLEGNLIVSSLLANVWQLSTAAWLWISFAPQKFPCDTSRIYTICIQTEVYTYFPLCSLSNKNKIWQ